MVQKYQSPVRVYKHPFEMVMAAYQKRFPTCDMIPIFVGCDIISDIESDDKATHVIERKCKLNVDAPRLLKRMVGFEFVYFVQKNSLNRKERTLKISAYNDSFSSRVVINEHCQYTVHPENSDWTCFEQSATMEIKSLFGFENTVEKLAIKQYAANIKKGKEIIEYYLNELHSSGIDHIPTWQDQNTLRTASLAKTSTSTAVNDSDIDSTHSRNSSFSSACGDQFTSDRMAGGKDDNLEEEYITHNLGVLRPLEESKLIQLRKWLSDTHNGKIPRDEHILRFLKSRDFHMDKAREVLCQSLSWRKQHQIDRLLDSHKPPQILEQYYLGGWHHFDNEGRPIYVLKLGQMDTKGLLKAAGEEQILRHVLHVMEEGLQKCRESSVKNNKPQSSWTCLIDLEGLNMRHLWRPGVQALLRIIEIIETNYPETMARLLIVRSPRVFPVLWTLISPFIDEKTTKKFMMYTGSDYQGEGGLVDFIPKEFIPDFIGGPCKCLINDGEPVPKSLYKMEWEKGDGVSLWEDTIYKPANVFKGLPHEVVVEVPEKDCVVTWDFDSLKGDVLFTLFHSQSPMGPLDCGDMQSCIATGSIGNSAASNSVTYNVQVLNKNVVLGKDYTIAEEGIVCREGESVQGSHIARRPGFYILQWKFHGPPSQTSTVQDVLYQVTHNPKAKVIYYHELLTSENFRGSMSSLESCASAFSSLSHATTTSFTSK